MRKKFFYFLLLVFVIPLIAIVLSNYTISNAANGKTYNSVTKIPKQKVGIVLGTSQKLANGQANPFYTYRINATIQLYAAGKIAFVLVSGDNGTKYYNEPNVFKKDLIAGGIPEEKIFLDFAGFRTLDSMVRAKVVFGLDSATVISQKFHNERAIYLAQKKGLAAIAFNADDVTGKQGFKVHSREYLARVKVFIDLLLNTQPKFLGDTIEIK